MTTETAREYEPRDTPTNPNRKRYRSVLTLRLENANLRQHVKTAIAAMLNAQVTLQTLTDNANVTGTLMRQARRDALGLSEAIELLKGEDHAQSD